MEYNLQQHRSKCEPYIKHNEEHNNDYIETLFRFLFR